MMGGLDGQRRMMSGEVLKPKNIGATLARFWVYFRPYWVGLVIAGLLMVASTWTQVATPALIGQAVDCYLVPREGACWYTQAVPEMASERLNGLLGLVGTLALIFVAGSAFQGGAFYAMNWTGLHALQDIRHDLFRHLQRLSLGYYAENEAGNLMSRVTNDTATIQQVMGFALLNVVGGVLLVVWITVEMLRADWIYALLSLSMVPLMAIATLYFSTQARKAFRATRREMGSVNAGLQESIAGAREVQAFNRVEESIEQFRRANAANRDANVRASSFTSALNPTLEALGYVSIAIVIVVGGLAVLRGQPVLGLSGAVSLGLVITFIQYVQRFNQPIQQIAVLWTNIQSAIAGGERIFGLLDERLEIVDAPDAREMAPIAGRVEFHEVHAEYKRGQPVLKGVSFVAEPGQTVAIVGPTGAGKTTIVNMIPRFYDVSGGAVLIDGQDVCEVTLESLRRQIGIVLQDSFLFSDTVMNNIRYGKLDATDEEVIEAARMASADAFIARLPEGYQTVLGERGSGLSQGQRQLIAIARAILANPRILILDEATSSVDTRTERLIQAAFDRLLNGRTSFVIAHRLSTIRNADQVLMVVAGEIVERGTHEELLARRGAYYQLYMSQFRREEEPVGAGDGAKVA